MATVELVGKMAVKFGRDTYSKSFESEIGCPADKILIQNLIQNSFESEIGCPAPMRTPYF